MSETNTGNGRIFSLIALFALGLIVVIFTIQNSQVVPIKMLTAEVDLSLALVIFASLFIGVLIAVSIFLPAHWRVIRERNKAQKSVLSHKDELLKLKKSTVPPVKQ